MNSLEDVARFITYAVNFDPPQTVLDICGDYYSPYYYLMYMLAQNVEQRLFVELGVEKARGCGSLALANPDNEVVGFDNNLRDEAIALAIKLPNLTVHERSSLPVPKDLIKAKISILHIDTEHSHSMAKAEFEAYQPHLAKNAIVLFDDIHAQNDGVLTYFYSLLYPKIQHDDLHPSCGYGVLLYDE